MDAYHLLQTPVTYTKQAWVHNRAADLRALVLDLGRLNPTWTMEQILSFSMTEKFARQSNARSIAQNVADATFRKSCYLIPFH
jgi:hypothetical protein